MFPDASSSDEEHSGHYQIIRRLGEGGYGQVFEAWDTKLCRSIALKRLKARSCDVQSERLLEEGRLAASLQHTAFVKIFSIEGDGQFQSIIMELVQGDTLRQFAHDKVLPDAQALDIIRQVAEAMEEAHAAQLVHGDIKPSNLMVEPSGRVRILDFGLARQIDPLATQTYVAEETPGTISYMSTERLLGQAPSARGDVYSLGVVLYELVAGQRPFPHLSGLALAAAHIQSSSELWTFPPGADAAVVALVRAMTARDAAQRMPTMEAVRAAVDALRAGAPAQLAPCAPSAPAPARRQAVRRWAIGALALALLLGAGLFARSIHWGTFPVRPYSEAATMSAGVELLRVSDRGDNLERAIGEFNSILERNPQHAGAAAGLSLAYSLRFANDGQDETWLRRADASAQQAIRQDDQLALAYAAQAWVREFQGKMDEALRIEDQALSLDPHNLFALNGKAQLLLRQQRFGELEPLLQGAIGANPKERWFTDLLGTMRYQQNRYPEAEQAFRRSIKLDPDSAISYANLNAALLRQNRSDEALQILQQGLQVRPMARLYTNLGTVLFERGDYVAAARAFERAVSASKGSPNDYMNWANLADTLRWIPGRGAESRHAYQQAADLLKPMLERSPNESVFQSRMGLYLAKLGDKQGAVNWSERALALAPSSADVHFRAALAHEINGNRKSALAELLRAKALGYPSNAIDTEPDLIELRRDIHYHNPN